MFPTCTLRLFLCIVGFCCASVRSACIDDPISDSKRICNNQPYIELLVSPLREDENSRHVSVYWEHLPIGCSIGIFSKNPKKRNAPLLYSYHPNATSSWVSTNVSAIEFKHGGFNFKAKCLPMYAGYKLSQNGKWLGVTCLRVEPTWMEDLKEQIGDKALKDVIIPGTHDSPSYQKLSRDNFLSKYYITQDETILDQLIYGSRYIDLRAEYCALTGKFWANHDIIPLRPIHYIFDDVIQFLSNTKEIIFLDIHELRMSEKKRPEFLKYVKKYFKAYYVPTTKQEWNSTFNEIWKTGRRLIITLGEDLENYGKSNPDFIWPPIVRKWGNVRKSNDLYKYMSSVMQNPPRTSAWVIMTQLTPTKPQIILDAYHGGLRVIAETLSMNISRALRCVDWSERANIVAVDFLRCSTIVSTAIQWNSRCRQCSKK